MTMPKSTADLNAREEASKLYSRIVSDGSFDANPERLEELADQARNSGFDKTANFWESQIGLRPLT